MGDFIALCDASTCMHAARASIIIQTNILHHYHDPQRFKQSWFHILAVKWMNWKINTISLAKCWLLSPPAVVFCVFSGNKFCHLFVHTSLHIISSWTVEHKIGGRDDAPEWKRYFLGLLWMEEGDSGEVRAPFCHVIIEQGKIWWEK